MKTKQFNLVVIVYACITLLCVACSSPKVYITGNVGVEIYNSEYVHLGTIKDGGRLKVKLSKKNYTPFLLAHETNSSLYVPFALDYKYKSHRGGRLLGGIGLFSGIGLIPTCCIVCSTTCQWDNDFNYLKYQNPNLDCRFISFIDNGETKGTESFESQQDRGIKLLPQENTVAARRNSSVSKRTLNDNAKFVSGTYSGTGYLAQKGKIIEEYSNVKVVVLRIDNNTVNVDVVENGESYFSTKSKYQVKKKGKNTYVLSLNGIPDAFITIDNAGHLTYIHPKVNIDGDIYTLNITATKK